MVRRYGLRDEPWEQIKQLLPGRADTVGVTVKDPRLFVEAVLYRYRTGIPWRDLPERCGAWKNIHRRHRRWSESGVWKRVCEHLAGEADKEYARIDATIVRVHQHAAGAQGETKRQRASDVHKAD
jgi:transposase